jgi:hypothetical protein
MSSQQCLSQLCTSVKESGESLEEVLTLLHKLLSNIKNSPREQKYHSLRIANPRLQRSLFCFVGSKDFLEAAGFEEHDGVLEFKSKNAVKFNDAFLAVLKRYSAECESQTNAHLAESHVQPKCQRVAGITGSETAMTAGYVGKCDEMDKFHLERYSNALKGSVKGAGRSEVYALKGQPGGSEALRILQKVLLNLKRFPNQHDYKVVNLDGKTGKG